ncbi:MAG: hypothetical protein HPY65_00935 [Syntrophaceae bacterium]|nr:hypothetical protein [Syntrophaceae bacterium]
MFPLFAGDDHAADVIDAHFDKRSSLPGLLNFVDLDEDFFHPEAKKG